MIENKYLTQLDGIRAFAILSVLISHFIPSTYLINRLFHFGRFGVVVFFVLSGYLITAILLRYRDSGDNAAQTKWQRVGVFLGRRILRIFPIYYLTIAIAAILAYGPVRNYLIWHIFYISNMAMALQGINFEDAEHLWSLCVEEQFYVLWPMAVIFLPQRFMRILAVFMIMIGVLYKYIGAEMGLNWIQTSFILPGCIDSLGLGALVAIDQHQQNDGATKRLIYWSTILGPLALISLQVIRAIVSFDVREEPFYQGLIDVVISISFLPVLVSAIHDSPGRLAALLNWRPLRYLGRISYGMYLYHLFLPPSLPLLTSKIGLSISSAGIGGFLIYTSVTIGMAAISWHLLEKPITGLKRYIVFQTAPSP